MRARHLIATLAGVAAVAAALPGTAPAEGPLTGVIGDMRCVAPTDAAGIDAILSAAGRHFATSVKGLRYLEGSYDRHLVRYMLGDEDITFGWGGWAPAIVRTGLGIKAQEDFVYRLASRSEVLIG